MSEPFNRNRPTSRTLTDQERVAQAVALRQRHQTYEQIAEALNYSTRAAAYNAVKREMRRRAAQITEGIDDLRDREAARLEELARHVRRVLETDHYVVSGGKIVEAPGGGPLIDDGPVLQAVDRLIKVSESMRRLYGLDAATKVEAAVTVEFTVKGVPTEELP